MNKVSQYRLLFLLLVVFKRKLRAQVWTQSQQTKQGHTNKQAK